MNVQTFTTMNERTLDRKINEFIESNDREVVNIKLS